MSKLLIYGLVDPRTGELRYVGKSTSGLKRPRNHCSPSHLKYKTHCAAWIRSLIAIGIRPDIVILDESPFAGNDTLEQAEIFWIAYWRAVGADLTNHTAGGEGLRGRRHSEETKYKIGSGWRGKKRPEMYVPVIDHLGRVHESIKAAGQYWDIDPRYIDRVLKGKIRQAYGCAFRYFDGIDYSAAVIRPKIPSSQSKPVKNLDTGEVFPNIRAASKSIGAHPSMISNALAGRQKTVKGMRWAVEG